AVRRRTHRRHPHKRYGSFIPRHASGPGIRPTAIDQSDPILLKLTSLTGTLFTLLGALLNQFYLLTRECDTHPLRRLSSGISPLGALAVAPVRSSLTLAPHRKTAITAQRTHFGLVLPPKFEELRPSVPARPLQRTRRWGRAQVRRLWAKKSSSTRRRSRHV